jgi:hypothetical protein
MREAMGGKGQERGKGGVMTQSLYAHMNKGNFKRKIYLFKNSVFSPSIEENYKHIFT